MWCFAVCFSTQWGCGLYQAVLCECLSAEGYLLQLSGGVPALSSRRHPQCHTALVPGHRRRHLWRAPHQTRARQWHPATVPLLALCLQQLHPWQWLFLHCWKPGWQDPQSQHSHQSRWVEGERPPWRIHLWSWWWGKAQTEPLMRTQSPADVIGSCKKLNPHSESPALKYPTTTWSQIDLEHCFQREHLHHIATSWCKAQPLSRSRVTVH